MIRTEIISETLVKTYSDIGVKVHGGFPEADYDEVIDPISENRTYTETNIPVDIIEQGIEAKAEAYDIITGVVE